MAQTPQPEKTGGAGGTEPATGRPQGLFGSATTILLIVFAAAVFWWSRRRRVELEEQLRAQRREAEATAERSALDVAHLMRPAPRAGAEAVAAREEVASAGPMPSAGAADPSAAGAIDDGTHLSSMAPDLEQAPIAADQDEALAREIERAEARAAADQAAEEQAEHASQSAQAGGESLVRRMAAASSAAEEAAADTADAAQMGLAPGVLGASGAERRADSDSQDAIPQPPLDAAVPAGAVAGDGTAICPAEYPIKGNRQSRIYHRPGQVSYPSTVPEYCFASDAAAESAGFRPSRARGQRSQSA